MLIRRLYLQNVKSFVDAIVDFQLGTNAIIGANGAGKSTLLEAIGFVLFDATPPGFTLSGFLREGAASGVVVVTLVSSLDGRTYDVERIFSASATTRLRVYDVDLGRTAVAETRADVQAWVRQHLRMDPSAKLDELFLNTIGVPQGTFTAPFLLAAAPRKGIFDPLLQVDDYSKASINLNAARAVLDKETQALAREIARAEGQLTYLPGIERELADLADLIRATEKDLGSVSAALADDQQALAALDAVERRVRETQQRLAEARLKRDALPPRLAAALQAVEEATRAAEIVAESEPAHLAYEAAEARLSALVVHQRQRDALVARRAAVDRDEALANAQREQRERDLAQAAQAQIAIGALASRVQEQARVEETLREAEADCVRQMNAAQRLSNAQEQERRALGQLRQAEQALERANAMEKEIDGLQPLIDADRQIVALATAEAAAARSEVQRLERQSATISETEAARCPVCEAELTPAHRDDILSRNASTVADLEGQRASAERARSEAEARIRQAEAQMKRLRREREGLGNADIVQRARSQADDWQRQRENAEREAAALADAPERRDAQRQELAALGDPRQQSAVLQAQADTRHALERDLAGLRDRLATLATGRSEIEAALEAFVSLDADLDAARSERERHRDAHGRYQENWKTAAQLAPRRAQVQEIQALLKAADGVLADRDREAQQAQAGYDRAAHDALRERVAGGRDQVARLSARRDATSTQRNDRQREADRLAGVQRDLVRLQSEQAYRQALERLLRVIQGLLREAGPHITQQLVRRISVEASSFYGDIMGDHSNHLVWSEAYDLTLDVKGRSRSFRQLSGGEQMCAAVALRLALLREMSHMEVAFFDEPTTNLDAERREGLADRIMQVRGFQQLFVISHDDTFERAAQNYVRIVKDGAGSHAEAV